MAATGMQAQKWPVGIVSVQDSVKSVQVGVISSVAADGGHGVQLACILNVSAAMQRDLTFTPSTTCIPGGIRNWGLR